MAATSFNERLKDLLLWENLSESTLAKKTGLPLKSVLHWTRGEYYPTVENLLVLSAYLRVSADCVLGLSDDFTQKKEGKSYPIKSAQEALIRHLIAYKKTRNCTFYRLAKDLGIGQSALSRWFNEGSMPETAMLIKISALLGRSIEELLGIK